MKIELIRWFGWFKPIQLFCVTTDYEFYKGAKTFKLPKLYLKWRTHTRFIIVIL